MVDVMRRPLEFACVLRIKAESPILCQSCECKAIGRMYIVANLACVDHAPSFMLQFLDVAHLAWRPRRTLE